jgi:pyruvate,water dikinase
VVATSFDANLDVRGKILVVHHIDPGWTLLFTQAAGIIAEKGNALSHAAIIAREIGIPAIVAVAGATRELKTGDRVSMNGITGSINLETN